MRIVRAHSNTRAWMIGISPLASLPTFHSLKRPTSVAHGAYWCIHCPSSYISCRITDKALEMLVKTRAPVPTQQTPTAEKPAWKGWGAAGRSSPVVSFPTLSNEDKRPQTKPKPTTWTGDGKAPTFSSIAVQDMALLVAKPGPKKASRALQKLDISNISSPRGLTDAGLLHVSKLPWLTDLNISGKTISSGKISREGFHHLTRLVNLSILDVSTNDPLAPQTRQGIADILPAFSHSLTSLYLPQTSSAIDNAIPRIVSLRRLDLRYGYGASPSGDEPFSLERFLMTLTTLPSLTDLTLCHVRPAPMDSDPDNTAGCCLPFPFEGPQLGRLFPALHRLRVLASARLGSEYFKELVAEFGSDVETFKFSSVIDFIGWHPHLCMLQYGLDMLWVRSANPNMKRVPLGELEPTLRNLFRFLSPPAFRMRGQKSRRKEAEEDQQEAVFADQIRDDGPVVHRFKTARMRCTARDLRCLLDKTYCHSWRHFQPLTVLDLVIGESVQLPCSQPPSITFQHVVRMKVDIREGEFLPSFYQWMAVEVPALVSLCIRLPSTAVIPEKCGLELANMRNLQRLHLQGGPAMSAGVLRRLKQLVALKYHCITYDSNQSFGELANLRTLSVLPCMKTTPRELRDFIMQAKRLQELRVGHRFILHPEDEFARETIIRYNRGRASS